MYDEETKNFVIHQIHSKWIRGKFKTWLVPWSRFLKDYAFQRQQKVLKCNHFTCNAVTNFNES